MINKNNTIAVIGLGYVGTPLAVAFSEHYRVVGFDINAEKVNTYLSGKDVTEEVGDEAIRKCKIHFTSDESELSDSDFFIIAVPTPINSDKSPDLIPLESASKIVARYMKKGCYVIYESTVYPGLTESICLDILEQGSGLKCNTDFKLGYSPERINPGDKVHRLNSIKKIVAGSDEESCLVISHLYESIIDAGVFPVSSIAVAEAAKVAENSQRDINIAFMNELAMAFDRMNIDTGEVLAAMNTKWNALGFQPGLVGGHCIGVDPYYFIYQTEKLGYHSHIITASRTINDDMGDFIARKTIRQLILADHLVKGARVALLGITFKENCPDTRNSKVVDIYKALSDFGANVIIHDPMADPDEVKKHYGINLHSMEDLMECDAVIIAVAHTVYYEMGISGIMEMFRTDGSIPVLIDVKRILCKDEMERQNVSYWSL